MIESTWVRARAALVTAVLVVLLFVPLPAHAAVEDEPEGQRPDFRFAPPRVSLGVRAGWAFNRSDSDIYTFFADELTLEQSDFDHAAVAFDFGWRINDRVDIVLGIEHGRRAVVSELRDFVTLDDLPIVQETRLSQTPITLSLKFYLASRGRRVSQYAWVPNNVVPYVGGGGGVTHYKLEQFGEFVDFRDLVIFEDFFLSQGQTVSLHAFAGVDIMLSTALALVVEGRYHWADAELRDSFIGFAPIDLTGARATVGVSWKL